MKFNIFTILVILFFNFLGVVYSQPGANPLFQKIDIKSSGVKFRNNLRETDTENMLSFINFYTGSGVGIIDVNNDGLQDIFFAGNLVTSRLYLNEGGLKFQDITSISGIQTNRWVTGVSIVDINQDGFDDIYLSVSGSMELKKTENLLFINNRNNTFSEKALEYNLNVKEQTTHTSFFDYDRDGDLDAFLATNPTDYKLNSMEAIQKPLINGESRGTDKLLRNDGNGKYSDVSIEAGILVEGYTLGVNTSDFNHDGWIDIYVSNDFISNDILYINNGDGTFTDELSHYFSYTSFASMGNDAGDINNDGLIDLITLDMLPESSFRQKVIVGTGSYDSFLYTASLGFQPQYSRNMLQLNNGNNTFSEIGRLAGISKTDWSWAPLLIDLDNDGDKDLFVTTGFRRDMGNMDFIYKTIDSPFNRVGEIVSISEQLESIKRFDGVPIMNYVFRNNNDFSFTKVSNEWGFIDENYSSGAAAADLDNDGDYDLIVNNVNDHAIIYENKANNLKNHYLKISLTGPKNNTSGIGSKITIYYNGNLQYVENNPYRGYMSTVDKGVLFGTGKYTMIDSVLVIWPDGLRTTLYDTRVDATLNIQYQPLSQKHSIEKGKLNKSPMFKDITSNLRIIYVHKEDLYVDFYNQPLLPLQHSRLGPSIAVGDINNDGLEDFFIGGALRFPGTLFFQNSTGTFRSEEFPFDQNYEDMGSLLFDFDGDSDLDLYVVSGGTSAKTNLEMYQDRLYMNIGNGKFKKTENVLPQITSSGSVVTAADFDSDGDLDLFVGGRISPMNYPNSPRSYLFENNDGQFIDVTKVKAPGLSSIGMVTAALWSDFNGDGDLDLIILGEWMPITVYENKGGHFLNRTLEYGFENTSGWWNSIISGNFNNDNCIDYMLGNLGLNNPYVASESEPLKVVSKDFDNNGVSDPILIMKYIDGYFPIASRSQFLSAFPQKANKYDTYQAYAKTKEDELLKDLGTDNVMSLEAKIFSNSLLLGGGLTKPILNTLPNKAQFAPIFGTLGQDLDGDRKTDVLYVGNFFSNNVIDGPFTASTGGLISLDPHDNISIRRGHENGFNVFKDAKALASLVLGDQKIVYLVSSNSDSLKAFTSVNLNYEHIKLRPLEAYAIIEWNNDFQQKQEFYYGSGYLSQSSRYLSLVPGWRKIKLIDYSGEERIITPDKIKSMK